MRNVLYYWNEKAKSKFCGWVHPPGLCKLSRTARAALWGVLGCLPGDPDRKCHDHSHHLPGTEPPRSHVPIPPELVCGGSEFQCSHYAWNAGGSLHWEIVNFICELFCTNVFHSSFWCDWMLSPGDNGIWQICCNLSSSELPNDYEQKCFHEISNVLMGLRNHSGYCADILGV